MTFFPSASRHFVFLLALLIALFFALPDALFADGADPEPDAANRAFTSGNYDESAHLFQKIIDTRGYSASLCFNLANAEAQTTTSGSAPFSSWASVRSACAVFEPSR